MNCCKFHSLIPLLLLFFTAHICAVVLGSCSFWTCRIAARPLKSPYTCSLYVLSGCSHTRFRSLCNSSHQAVYTHFHTGVATVHYTVLCCVIGYSIRSLSECIQQKNEYKSHLHTHTHTHTCIHMHTHACTCVKLYTTGVGITPL